MCDRRRAAGRFVISSGRNWIRFGWEGVADSGESHVLRLGYLWIEPLLSCVDRVGRSPRLVRWRWAWSLAVARFGDWWLS